MKPTRSQRREVKALCKRFEAVSAAPPRRRLITAVIRRLAYRVRSEVIGAPSNG